MARAEERRAGTLLSPAFTSLVNCRLLLRDGCYDVFLVYPYIITIPFHCHEFPSIISTIEMLSGVIQKVYLNKYDQYCHHNVICLYCGDIPWNLSSTLCKLIRVLC